MVCTYFPFAGCLETGEVQGCSRGGGRAVPFEERIAQEKVIFSKARGITVTSEAERENYKRLYDYVSDNMVTIPPGLMWKCTVR